MLKYIRRYNNQFKCHYYAPIIKHQTTIDLTQKWYDIPYSDKLLIPKWNKCQNNNLRKYLSLSYHDQYNCYHFGMFVCRTYHYTSVPNQGDIVFLDKKHIALKITNQLYISKLGMNGIYVNFLSDLIKLYKPSSCNHYKYI